MPCQKNWRLNPSFPREDGGEHDRAGASILPSPPKDNTIIIQPFAAGRSADCRSLQYMIGTYRWGMFD